MGKTTKRLLIWATIVFTLLTALFVLTQHSESFNWDFIDYVVFACALLGGGVVYELLARKKGNRFYRLAFLIGLLGALLLAWVNGAVGLIGNENQDANMLFSAVFIVGFIGSLVSRFKAEGMAKTLFLAAFVQLLVPLTALFIWPPNSVSWSPGVLGVFLMVTFFALLFLISGLLFKRASNP